MLGISTIGIFLSKIASNVGITIISEPIVKYLKKRFKIFEKKVEKVEGKEKIILIQKEIITLKNIQISILEKIIKEDLSKEEEVLALKEFKEKTIFVEDIETLLKKS